MTEETEFSRNIRRLEEAIAEAKEVIREAHVVIKDLRGLLKTADKVIEEGFSKKVHDQVEEISVAVGKACDDATQKVFERFDKVFAALMGRKKSFDLAKVLSEEDQRITP